MELDPQHLSEADVAYRDELHRWLAQNIESSTDDVEWHRRLVEGRWVVPAWPSTWGGRQATLTQQLITAQLMGEFDAPPPRNSIGLFNIGPMLLQHGTPEQQERWLPAMVTADEIWCQGFSEPDAGSDLAALSTRAVRDGEDWLVTGQKVWTSFGDDASWCLALVRTNPDVKKHKGITAMVIDMRAPGVDVRPLREITGEDGFNEIFFDEVRVTADCVVGEVDGGWGVAMSTLTHERLGAMKLGFQLKSRLDDLVALARRCGADADPVLRDRIARVAIDVDLMQLLTRQAMTALQRGVDPGVALPLGKLQWSELMQTISELALDIQGPWAMVAAPSPLAIEGRWQHHSLYSRMTTIAAGTTQVQKNIIAYRNLGLPRDATSPSYPGTVGQRSAALDEESAAFADNVRRFIDEQAPIEHVRSLLDDPTGLSPDIHKSMAEMGLLGLLVPAEAGGLGLGYAQAGPVIEELGRGLDPGPFLSTAVAAVSALREIDSLEAATLMEQIAVGASVVAVAVHEPDSGWDIDGLSTSADREADSAAPDAWRVSGHKMWVPDAQAADVLLVAARDGDALAWFRVDVDAAGDTLQIIGHPGMDPTAHFAEVSLSSAPASRLTDHDDSRQIAAVIDRWAIARVADAVGAASRALEIANDYAKVRIQFDQPIGAFQAVQHLLADVLRRVELARAAAAAGLEAADGDDLDDLHRAAATAQGYASSELQRAMADVIQVFGGIGFTWEHDAHLFYKRVLTMQHWLGGSSRHRAEYARRLFI